MTRPMSPAAQPVQGVPTMSCPYCLTPIAYDPSRVYVPSRHGGRDSYDPSGEVSPQRRDDILANAQQLCVDPIDGDKHYVPVPYLTNGPPISIAFAGRSGTGKTNLAGAMLTELERSVLAPYGVRLRSLNRAMHDEARTELLDPMAAGEVLDHTRPGQSVGFLDAMLVETNGGARPVGFFDVAGEDLLRTDRAMRFLAGVSALVFVIDPVHALDLPQLRREPGWLANGNGDPTFGAVLDRMPRTGGYIDVPTTVVLAKSDLVRFEPPVDRWLAEPTGQLDPTAVRRESEDVYAFVDAHGGGPWLRPVADVRRCTLHFVSATGGAVRDGSYPTGAKSRRAAQPLLSLFAMCGLLGPRFTQEVGR